MGRIYKLSPAKSPPKSQTEESAKRVATAIKRKRARGKKTRVVLGSAVARALGIK